MKFLIFLFIFNLTCYCSSNNILTIDHCIKRALNYSQTSVQIKQKNIAAHLNFKDFYLKNFNYTIELNSSFEKKKDLSYSFYEYLYDTSSEKSSLTDKDVVTSSIDLKISKQFKFATKAVFYNKIETNSSFSLVDKDGDFSDTTLDQYSSYSSNSYLYNPETGIILEHYILGKNPDKLKFSLKDQQYKLQQSEFTSGIKNHQIIEDTVTAYYKYAISLKVFEFKLMSYTESKKTKDFAEKIYKLGQISKYDLNKIDIELLESNAEKENSQSEYMNNKKNLMLIIGMPSEADVTIPDIKYENFDLNIENCKELLLQSQPDIEIIKLKISKIKNDITLAEKEFLPDVKIFGGIALEGNNKEFADSYKKMKNKWNIGFDVNYSLYDFNSKTRKQKIANSELIEMQASLRQMYEEYTIKFDTAYNLLKQAEITVEANTKKAVLAKENMEFMKKKYFEGQADIDDHINSKKQYYSSEISKLNSYLKAFSARTKVEKLIRSGFYAMENH